MSKRKEKKIQDRDRLYDFLHLYVDAVVRSSYRTVDYNGQENIPTDGAIIFAPNHANTLMDALVVLAFRRNPKVFVARADIFRKPTLAKICTFLKIMPIMRQRDGFNEVKKNFETINKAVDVLKDKIPFCIFPEGRHQAKYSLLPLSKGIFRIAFQAHEMMPDMPLYIVPTGIVYGDFFRFRSTVRVQFGKPINVGEYIAQRADMTPQEQMNEMRDVLEERLQSTIFYIPNDEDYDATYEVCKAVEAYEMAELEKDDDNIVKDRLDLQFVANKHTLARLTTLKEVKPMKAQELMELAREASRLRQKKGISIETIARHRSVPAAILRALIVLLTLPYSLLASLFALPEVLVCKVILPKMKDRAFWNSLRTLILMFIWPLFMIIYAVVALCLFPWPWALGIIVLLYPAPIVAHELWKVFRLGISRFKLSREKRLKSLYAKIKEIMTDKYNFMVK